MTWSHSPPAVPRWRAAILASAVGLALLGVSAAPGFAASRHVSAAGQPAFQQQHLFNLQLQQQVHQHHLTNRQLHHQMVQQQRLLRYLQQQGLVSLPVFPQTQAKAGMRQTAATQLASQAGGISTAGTPTSSTSRHGSRSVHRLAGQQLSLAQLAQQLPDNPLQQAKPGTNQGALLPQTGTRQVAQPLAAQTQQGLPATNQRAALQQQAKQQVGQQLLAAQSSGDQAQGATTSRVGSNRHTKGNLVATNTNTGGGSGGVHISIDVAGSTMQNIHLSIEVQPSQAPSGQHALRKEMSKLKKAGGNVNGAYAQLVGDHLNSIQQPSSALAANGN